MFHYLRNISCNSQFSISVLQTLIQERRSTHRERWNKNMEVYKFNKGDVVIAHIQVQSKLDNGKVGKLSYRTREPFQIIEDLGGDSYDVTRYNDASAPVRKYKGTDLYLLPPAIFPCDSLDTMDVRFLNYSNAPVISPLKKSLKIEIYNDTYFNKQPTSQSASKDVVSCQLDELAI